MKKVILVFMLVMCLTGCAKVISETTETVQVTVTDTYYKKAYTYMQYNATTKMTTPIRRPARYIVTVEYDGVKYTFSGKEIYDKYKDKKDEKIDAILSTKKYDNGTIKNKIIELN